MTVRKTLQELRSKLEMYQPAERIEGIEINIVDASAEGGNMIVGRMYVQCGKPAETITEEYPEGDPRRVKWENPNDQ